MNQIKFNEQTPEHSIILNNNQLIVIIQSFQHSIKTNQFDRLISEELEITIECLQEIILSDTDIDTEHDLSFGAML